MAADTEIVRNILSTYMLHQFGAGRSPCPILITRSSDLRSILPRLACSQRHPKTCWYLKRHIEKLSWVIVAYSLSSD